MKKQKNVEDCEALLHELFAICDKTNDDFKVSCALAFLFAHYTHNLTDEELEEISNICRFYAQNI